MSGRGRGLLGWGLVLLCLGLILFGGWVLVSNLNNKKTSVTVGSTIVSATVVTTEEERELGLGGVESLGSSEGMLFVFPQDGPQEIWMKDMKINIDVIWLNKDKRVVHIERKLTPASYPRTYRSPKLARYVLEVPAGTAARSGVAVGSTATFNLP